MILTILLISLFGLGMHESVHAFSTDPKPTKQFVVDDYAHILDPETKHMVIRKGAEYKYDTYAKPQVGIVTVPSSDGDITDYSNDLLDQNNTRWHFGNKKYNNGVVILFAKNGGENNVRINTGYGVESILPDLKTNNFLRQNYSLLKSHSKAKVNEGLQNVFLDVTHVIDKKYANLSKSQIEALNKNRAEQDFGSVDHSYIVIGLVIALIIFIVIALLIIFHNSYDDSDSDDNDHYYGGHHDPSDNNTDLRPSNDSDDDNDYNSDYDRNRDRDIGTGILGGLAGDATLGALHHHLDHSDDSDWNDSDRDWSDSDNGWSDSDSDSDSGGLFGNFDSDSDSDSDGGFGGFSDSDSDGGFSDSDGGGNFGGGGSSI